jgi:thiol-disulfide isomerase/thioredoxin
MKYLLTLTAIACLSLSAAAQKAYTTSKDNETGATIFKGQLTMEDLQGEPSFTWLKRGETAYKPDSNAIKFLRKELPGHTIVVIMGTWCDDSQNLLPKLSKALEAARFPNKQLVMYGVDRSKQTGGIESKIYDVKRVPTIIVFKGNLEKGRIVESVKRDIETDLVQILQKGSNVE